MRKDETPSADQKRVGAGRITCPFCGNEPIWCENSAIYGRNYGKSYMCYFCKPCDAYVGCHQNTTRPLGTLANKETREWRMKAHVAFDPIWKSGKIKRWKAYKMLSDLLKREVHIGESSVEQCKEIITALTTLFPTKQ